MPGSPETPHMSESEKIAALKFAQCMREHGVPNFPDPGPTTNGGLQLSLRGMIFPAATGIDPTSPAFRKGAAECGIKPPPG
jgi:hypothetical protein